MKPLELKTADTTVQGTSNGSSRDSTTLSTIGAPLLERTEAVQASLSKSIKIEFISSKKSKKNKKQSRDTAQKFSPRKQYFDKKQNVSHSKKKKSFQSPKPKVQRSVFRCNKCNFWCSQMTSFHSHTMVHKKTPCFKCSYCQFSGYFRGVIWNHIHKSSETDPFHKRATCISLINVPSSRYSDNIVVEKVPSNTKCGFIDTDCKPTSSHVAPVDHVTPSNVPKNKSLVCYSKKRAPATKSSSSFIGLNCDDKMGDTTPTSLLIEEKSFNEQLASILASDPAILQPSSNLDRQIGLANMKAEYLIKEKYQIESAVRETYDALEKSQTTLREEKKLLAELHEKITHLKNTFVERYQDKVPKAGDNPIAGLLSSLMELRDQIYHKLSQCSKQKLMQEINLRQHQKSICELTLDSIEVDENSEKFVALDKQLKECQDLTKQSESNLNSINIDILRLKQEKLAVDGQISEIDPVNNELILLDFTAKTTESQIVTLQTEMKEIIEQQKARIQKMSELERRLIFVTCQEALLLVDKNKETNLENLAAYQLN